MVFSNVEARWVNATLLLCQQVENILLVNLEVAATDQVLDLGLVLLAIFVHNAENVCETVRDYTAAFRRRRIAHHRVRFSTPRLPIRKYCAIVTFKHGFDQGERNFIIDGLLKRVSVVDCVKGEWHRHGSFLIQIDDCDIIAFSVTCQTRSIT